MDVRRIALGLILGSMVFVALYIFPIYFVKLMKLPYPLINDVIAVLASVAAIITFASFVVKKPYSYILIAVKSIVVLIYIWIVLRGGILYLKIASANVTINVRFILYLSMAPEILSIILKLARFIVEYKRSTRRIPKERDFLTN